MTVGLEAGPYVSRLEALCREKSIAPKVGWVDDLYEELDALIGLLLKKEVEDPRLDEAVVFLTNEMLAGKYHRSVPALEREETCLVYENGKTRRLPTRAESDAAEEQRLLEEQRGLRFERLCRRWGAKHVEERCS